MKKVEFTELFVIQTPVIKHFSKFNSLFQFIQFIQYTWQTNTAINSSKHQIYFQFNSSHLDHSGHAIHGSPGINVHTCKIVVSWDPRSRELFLVSHNSGL